MKMKALFVSGAAVMALFAAVPATAQEFSFSWGGTVTSNYVSRGFTQTNNRPAFQPWVEVESNGFYAGLWASNIDFPPDSVEIDVYGGYRWSIESTSLDLGYARYFYNNSGDLGGEIYLLGSHEAGKVTLFGGVYFGHTGGLTLNDAHGGFSVALMDRVSASTRVGIAGGAGYGDVGVSYAINDNFEVDARLHHGVGIGTRAVASVSFGF